MKCTVIVLLHKLTSTDDGPAFRGERPVEAKRVDPKRALALEEDKD